MQPDGEDLADLCRLVAQGLVRIVPLIRDVLPVSEADDVYEVMRDSPNELYGTVFVW